MARLAWERPRDGRRWRTPAIVALSLGAHVLVLVLFGLRSMEVGSPRDRPGPVIYLDIEPRPLLAGEVARVRPPPARPAPSSQRLPDAGERSPPSDLSRRAEDDDDRAVPAPRAAAPGAPAPPADVGTAPWQVRPETTGDRVGRSLRGSPVGCASPQLLSDADRAACFDRFAAGAAAAAPIQGTGNPERDDRFAREGRRALATYEARRRPLSGGIGIVGVTEGPGSNFGMGVAGAHLDPALRPDSTTNVRTRRDRIRELEED